MTLQAGANQPPPLEPYDLFATDPVLGAAMEREGAQRKVMASFGKAVGTQEVFEWGFLANRRSPELATHDRFGNRIDEVRYHPAYHSLLDMSVSAGIHCMRYESQPGDGGVVTRNALMYLMSQAEVGHGCPTSMTSAALGALEHQPELAATWRPRLVSLSYDPRLVETLDRHLTGLRTAMGGHDVGGSGTSREAGARRLVEQMAQCWAASLLVQHGDPALADTYVQSRLVGDWGSELGTLNPTANLSHIAARAVPSR